MIVLQWLNAYTKSFSKKDLVYVLIIAMLTLGAVKKCHIGSPDSTTVIAPVFKPTVKMKDKNGNTYTEVQGAVFTEKEMKHLTDSISKALGKGKVAHIIETITVIDTVVQVKEEDIYIDTTSGSMSAKDSTKNSYMAFSGNYKTKQATLTLRLTPDTATFVTTIKKHLFKANEMNVNIYHTNDLFTPAQGKAYTATVPKTIACVGPVIGVGYTNKIVPFIGIGVTLNVWGIKFKH